MPVGAAERASGQRWVGFLRGVNVGGHHSVPMPALVRAFESAGAQRARSYRASGNIRFDLEGGDVLRLGDSIESSLARLFGSPVRVFLRSTAELRAMVADRPFAQRGSSGETEYVTLLDAAPRPRPSLPILSPNRDVELVKIVGANVLSRTHPTPGRAAFPNPFIERLFRVPATTRNWRTIEGISALDSIAP